MHKLQRHELRIGSCLDPRTGLASLGDKSVDVCIMDPPYEAEAHNKQRRQKAYAPRDATAREDGMVAVMKPLPFPPITASERYGVSLQMARLCRRWVLVFCQVEAAPAWRECLEDGGLQYVRTMVWVKPDGQPQLTGDRPAQGYEAIILAHPHGRKRWNGGGRKGVFIHSKQETTDSHTRGGVHPTKKPLALMRELVELFSEPGELVCDPYAGSGSTGVACRALGRRFLGWEINPEYAAIARQRIEGATPTNNGQLALL